MNNNQNKKKVEQKFLLFFLVSLLGDFFFYFGKFRNTTDTCKCNFLCVFKTSTENEDVQNVIFVIVTLTLVGHMENKYTGSDFYFVFFFCQIIYKYMGLWASPCIKCVFLWNDNNERKKKIRMMIERGKRYSCFG